MGLGLMIAPPLGGALYQVLYTCFLCVNVCQETREFPLNFLSCVRLLQGITVRNEQCHFPAGRLSAAVLCGRRFLVSHCVLVNTHAAGSRR